jgi:drug/metabolite transporter (DMT)-like permease
LGEAIGWSTAIGGAMVLAGIYIASRAEVGIKAAAANMGQAAS